MRYHLHFALSVLVAILFGDLATPLSPRWGDMRSKHFWDTVPEDWECLGGPPNGTTIDLYVALRPHRKDALIDALYEVSNPGHPKYGAHLSREQVAELVAPHPNVLELVHSWLKHRGVPTSSVIVTHGGNSLRLTGVSVPQANDLLGASYQVYRNVKTDETIVRTVGYALPAVLHRHVQTVAPTTSFDSPRTVWKTPRKRFGEAAAEPVEAASGEPVTVPLSREYLGTTPSFLSWLYSTWVYSPVATGQNVLGIVGLSGQYPSPRDLGTFMSKYRTNAADATFTVVLVNDGVYDQGSPNVESNFEMQYAQGMAYPTRHVFYSTGRGASGTDDWYLSWLEYILHLESIPQTISISYGNYEKLYPREYATHVCYLFALLGARGVSVLFMSGDNGVGEGDCGDGSGNLGFNPVFPATCPWVTTVGGTTGHMPEVGASFSGGGFSNYFGRPDYQHQAVSTFLLLQDLENQYRGLYNASGRGIPDIAAQAVGFRLFFNNVEKFSYGTTGSTPIVAGIISLLNDHLLSEGKPPLGFLNPWLYTKGFAGFKDITSGSNPGCNTHGFSAIPEWDPVTGFGTPDFEKLQYILDLDLPQP